MSVLSAGSPLRRSLYSQFKVVIIFITFFVVIAAGPALVLTELSTGSGGAINVSGSLRMMSYKLTAALSDPYAMPAERESSTKAAVEEFSSRINSPGLTSGFSSAKNDPLRQRYERVKTRFEMEIVPLALESAQSEFARRQFFEKVPGFVDDVDRFVFALEESLSGRLEILKGCLLLTIAGALALSFLMLRIMRKKIFAPIEELEGVAARVRKGDFSTRSLSTGGSDEIGRFARGFNFMVDELERLYGSLEAEVAKKTADLNRRNRGLQFLARASEELMVDGPKLTEAVKTVLAGASELAGAATADLFITQNLQEAYSPESAYRFASLPLNAESNSLSWVQCAAHGSRVETIGMLQVGFTAPPDEWQKNFFDMTANLIGRTVEAVLKATDEQRLVVLEERSTIARELHDSIAQSLSFSKIQLLRLRRALLPEAPADMAQEVLCELDHGISTAYRQLREVLSAFRLQLTGTGFSGAVNDAVEAFRNRTGLQVTVKNALIGVELSSNDQVHFIQILREALANIEKHARARTVQVRLDRTAAGFCRLQVADDGIGISEHPEKASHFGLGIMKERANALEADLTVMRRESGGTLVLVVQHRKTANADSSAGRNKM